MNLHGKITNTHSILLRYDDPYVKHSGAIIAMREKVTLYEKPT
jgi:hypothetical protein